MKNSEESISEGIIRILDGKATKKEKEMIGKMLVNANNYIKNHSDLGSKPLHPIAAQDYVDGIKFDDVIGMQKLTEPTGKIFNIEGDK